MQLNDQGLLKNKAYIDGKWVDSDSGATFAVVNPATGETIAEVAKCGQAETRRAIEAAEKAQKSWAAKTAKERSAVLRKWFDLMIAHQEDLATIMTVEQGKPLAESRGEIMYAASFLEWFAEEGKRLYGDTIPTHRGDTRLVTIKQPIGVTAAITPWNFPSAMITRKAGPALASGCTQVLKPAEATPLSALALVELAERAGVPAGVLSVVTGDRDDSQAIGHEMTTSHIVRKISFTGSTAVGKLLMQQAAGTVKKVGMELGGNAPFIVFDDADLDKAIEGAIACKFRNAGQTCVCANRILVQDGIFDAFSARLAEAVDSFKVGNGMEDGVVIGPLINDSAVSKVHRLVKAAKASGAKAIAGGEKMDGNFYDPTLLVDVTRDMDIANEEIFGPVATLMRFSTEEEAIDIANDTPFGLAAYFYSRDIGRCWRVSEGLEYGMVGVNSGILSTELAPFGGVKESGIGREGSYQGIEDWVEVKYLCMGDI
ncbi:succinate semialdehyde dehydrogenase /glutarate-semialdehyde dehydrogenase [Aestuariispira insulae]|uniref:Succinate semialdehyde dehydrogenase /glutarate-semialdehyde dehydrogenase n=2 Tax=Aestuariispira insulae TaxID=1461337 RepID=A0A3D9HK41_9PROT|nr:succinate semialdehyde dehydrogenase /glutarate-semialdehyde dehydrogenase [Aestuariispira insulae]